MHPPGVAEFVAPATEALQTLEHDLVAGVVQQEIACATVGAFPDRSEVVDVARGIGFGGRA